MGTNWLTGADLRSKHCSEDWVEIAAGSALSYRRCSICKDAWPCASIQAVTAYEQVLDALDSLPFTEGLDAVQKIRALRTFGEKMGHELKQAEARLAERQQTVREDAARMIEVLYLPTYSQENAAIDGVLISRREAETDLKAIVAAIRAKEKA